MREFKLSKAERVRVPLLLGLVGPSGGGKTMSALRLATGIQKVVGGKIAVIDTEARRALHYASDFDFLHLPFGAPFDSLSYLEAIEFCIKSGAKTIIVDSASHEHEGPGGLLEQHEAELNRIAGDDYGKRERCKMLAWQKPKAARRKLINTLLQLDANFIFCFRAKEKMKLVPGRQPEQLGWMPIAGEEFVFEMTANMLLLPGANGQPTLRPDEPGERAMVKTPRQFASIISGKQLTEEMGEAMARWAEGPAVSADKQAPETKQSPGPESAQEKPHSETLAERLEKALTTLKTADTHIIIQETRNSLLELKGWSKEQGAEIRAAILAAEERIGA